WKDRIPQGIASSNLAPSANLYTTSFLFRPASGGARQSRLAGPKILILKNGGAFGGNGCLAMRIKLLYN
ncbi:hypothetical protein COS46_00980, partial [Candidatus Jorgensenbacteria bacterium CG03_land_8_20_14_0_80_38_39]